LRPTADGAKTARLVRRDDRNRQQGTEQLRDLRLHPGIPAEVYVTTPERTVLYLAKSLHVFDVRCEP
jgi:hypothetical protein